MEIESSVPLMVNPACPCDGNDLLLLCALMGRAIIRVGCCDSCGYVGYIDKPTREWFDMFYRSVWDKADTKTAKEKPYVRGLHEAAVEDIVNCYKIAKNARILEMGSGYGNTLYHLKQLGYTDLAGVEPSSHRVESAKRGSTIPTIRAPFEEAPLDAPYDLIYSFHVLEHVYDPAVVVKKCAALQPEGGYLVFVVPHKESVMTTLLFLPHLHRYTEYALSGLLTHAGYRVRKCVISDQEITIIAQKHKTEKVFYQFGLFKETLDYFRNRLGVGTHWYHPRLLWWYRTIGYDEGGQLPFLFPSLLWRWMWHFHHKAPLQAAVVEDAPHKTTAPLEIQFSGNIQMLIK